MELRLRKKFVMVIAIVGMLATLLSPARTLAAEKLHWERRTAITTPRHEFALAKSGRQVYVMGGFIEGLNTVPFVDIYDVDSDTWSMGPSLPIAPNHAMAAAHDGVVYHLGGYLVGLDQPTDRVLALIDDAWVDLPPMPEPRAAGAAEFFGNKLYVVGGVNPAGVVDDVFIYNPKTEKWSTAPGPKTEREHETLVRRGKYLYAVGGRQLTFETTMASVERFDPATKRWKSMPPLPFPAAGHVSAVTRNGLMVVAGGEVAAGPFGDSAAFDFERGKWLSLPPLEPGRTGFGAATFGNRFFVFGGAGGDPGYYDFTESIDLNNLR